MSIAGFLRNFRINILNCTFVQTSSTSCAGIIHCVGIDVCIRSIVVGLYLDAMTITGDSDSGGIVMNFAVQIVACSLCSSIVP